ncbi:hypothetical protein EBI_27519 [Enterocytozoon bieneusi H348]|nr:hypothetical protein EBI_27519 [Enterocytozoon bieneusi H348]|eukprot:XP_002650491.1 hypothetical protein EBI_27519 [Enterocytozoon bieneusi H348]
MGSLSKDFVDFATVASPVITVLVTFVGWLVVFKDSKSSANRAEIYDLLNKVINVTMDLNQRASVFFLSGASVQGKHQTWVASVSVEISSLRALGTILHESYSVKIPDDFFYSVRKNYTLNAEGFSSLDERQVLQKVSDQNSRVSRSLKQIYELYPSKKKGWLS